MFVTLSIKTKAGGGDKYDNSAMIMFAYFKNSDDWGTFQRMCKSRGIDQVSIARRNCDEQEYREHAHKYRAGFAALYKDWDALIKDEHKFTEDAAWFARLEELKAQYPQFNTHGQTALKT